MAIFQQQVRSQCEPGKNARLMLCEFRELPISHKTCRINVHLLRSKLLNRITLRWLRRPQQSQRVHQRDCSEPDTIFSKRSSNLLIAIARSRQSGRSTLHFGGSRHDAFRHSPVPHQFAAMRKQSLPCIQSQGEDLTQSHVSLRSPSSFSMTAVQFSTQSPALQ